MVDLELANEGDLLITRNNWCGRFRGKKDSAVYVITIEKNGVRITYSVNRSGNNYPSHLNAESSYDVITLLPSRTETPYFKLYELCKR